MSRYFPWRHVGLVFFLFMISCSNVTEEIYLQKDGSGQYMVYTDMVGATRTLMVEMMSSMYPDASLDSIHQVAETRVWEEFPKAVDSVLDFSSKVPDSIKNDPDKQKYLEKIEMFMIGGKAEGYLNTGIRFAFDDVVELQEIQDFLNDNQSSGSNQFQMKLPNVRMSYAFDGSTFTRTTHTEAVTAISDSTNSVINNLLGRAKYRLIIHLPTKPKKMSREQLIEKKGKDLIYEFELGQVVTGKQGTDINVSF